MAREYGVEGFVYWREYQVYGKGYSFGHGYTCYYYTQFYGDYLFHSSPYYVNSNRVMDPTMGSHPLPDAYVLRSRTQNGFTIIFLMEQKVVTY